MTRLSSILPQDITARAPTKDDVEFIANGVAANEINEEGRAETISEDIIELWEDTGTDLQANARVLVANAGDIIGYVGVSQGANSFMLDLHTHVHPQYHHRGLEHFLLQFAEERALYQLDSNPALPRLITTSSFRPSWTQILTQNGYTITSNYLRMEINLHDTPQVPQPLDGIVVRQYRAGQDEEAIHSIVQEAFQDIGGHPYRPFSEWKQRVLENPHFDPTKLYIALSGETIVGVIICRTYQDRQQGHIIQIAVSRPWRKRGIAFHLLNTVLGEFYRNGITTIFLDVDGHNTTGAHQLYQRAGMQKTSQIDHMQKMI